ncbi:hypothetical protein [Klebsiella variicola]|uniref:hypothetical protein n=2 Tax=Klebsiella variicola TaxID=244366 RepID=UPI0005842671|nr:hypothetical protein [Klebsiella variicola]HBZ7768737.1 hypothetical protein [Klebsiella variicola subsp. variicola]PXM39122.1 hypothetical protein DMT39_20040 [Klebsiella variicola]CEL88773.1 conserved hypothetical protein [Klebsiella variicola]HBZ7769440.1 hypothetical protein [Klebsiella variicola subsp. variicola]HBZ7769448.1 hypothetical protein [Klebsiella variicola subsp. variicola]
MLKLSEKQCASVDKMEDDDFVRDTAQKLKKKFPGINEPDDTFHVRLGKALDYARTLPLKEKKVRRDFLLLEAFWPGFYLQSEVDKWLRIPNGYAVDQRVKDYMHVMINRERRGP